MNLKDGIITLVIGTGLWDDNHTTVNLAVGSALSVSLPNAWEHLPEGTQRQLTLAYSATPATPVPFYWASSNESVATVSDGMVTAVAPGITKISASHGASLYAECQVVVHCPMVASLPAGTAAIGPETFENVPMQEVILPDSLTQIGERTFAGCTQLRMVFFLNDDVQIAENAFEGCSELFFLCREGSDAQQYAQANGIAYQILP